MLLWEFWCNKSLDISRATKSCRKLFRAWTWNTPLICLRANFSQNLRKRYLCEEFFTHNMYIPWVKNTSWPVLSSFYHRVLSLLHWLARRFEGWVATEMENASLRHLVHSLLRQFVHLTYRMQNCFFYRLLMLEQPYLSQNCNYLRVSICTLSRTGKMKISDSDL